MANCANCGHEKIWHYDLMAEDYSPATSGCEPEDESGSFKCHCKSFTPAPTQSEASEPAEGCVCGSKDHTESDHCKVCGLPPEDNVTHECPPGFLTPAEGEKPSREQAIDDAWRRFVKMYHSGDEQVPAIEQDAIRQGFDAGIKWFTDGVDFKEAQAMLRGAIEEMSKPASQQAPADLVSEARRWMEAKGTFVMDNPLAQRDAEDMASFAAQAIAADRIKRAENLNPTKSRELESDDLIAEAKAFIQAIDDERYPGGMMSGGGERPIKFREMASFAQQREGKVIDLFMERVEKRTEDLSAVHCDAGYWVAFEALRSVAEEMKRK